MAEDEKRFPVYKWHLIEVAAVQQLAERLRDQLEETGPKDKTYAFLRWFCCRLKAISDILEQSAEDIVMLDRNNRLLIEQVSDWLKKYPEVMTA